MDIKNTVNQAMKKQGMRPADLFRKLGGDKVKERTLYNFLNGNVDIGSTSLGYILDELSLTIQEKNVVSNALADAESFADWTIRNLRTLRRNRLNDPQKFQELQEIESALLEGRVSGRVKELLKGFQPIQTKMPQR